jgi:hypothetical protein
VDKWNKCHKILISHTFCLTSMLCGTKCKSAGGALQLGCQDELIYREVRECLQRSELGTN